MEANEIRKKFLRFFSVKGGQATGGKHAIVPSSSLIPDDSSVLLTTAGMQQFKLYYTGEADPVRDFGAKNTASVQKSFRTSDIDEIGDESHLTFFEMLGNFSFGGYWKKEAISFAHEFITKEMKLTISFVTVFQGSSAVPKDEESKTIWSSLGVTDVREEGMDDVFWGPTGTSGPCGPTTEIYCTNANGKDIEIWNIVFNEFFCSGSREQLLTGNATLKPLPLKGIDTGMGLERLAMISQKAKTIFETDLLTQFISLLPAKLTERKKRIITDHIRGMVFLLADGVRPSNKEAGYILRRLIRRVLSYEKIDDIPSHVINAITHEIIHCYGDFYPELKKNGEIIGKELQDERERFAKTTERGIRELQQKKEITGKEAFDLYQSYGLSPETILEMRPNAFDWKEFNEAKAMHLAVSGSGQEKKFGGHGLVLNTGELKAGNEEELKTVTRLHTATHLMNAALHMVLGNEIEQRGSDITAERTRFDFSFSRKLTPEEIKKIENIVNEAIKKNYAVNAKEYGLEDAKKTGALYIKKGKYPKKVKVYAVGGSSSDSEHPFSQELCGGPHVAHTGEVGQFKIIKEEASSAGVRRIRAIIR